MPLSLESIGRYAFFTCHNLVDAAIPSQVKSIGKFAFYGCESMTSIVIPSGVSEIGEETFSYCKSLTDVRMLSTTPPEADEQAFDSYDKVLKVPAEAISVYSETAPWSSFTSIVALENEDLLVKKCATPTITY